MIPGRSVTGGSARLTFLAGPALGVLLAATPAPAGDPAAGEAGFRHCTACHALTRPDGRVIVRGGATGPDLYGIAGRPAGGVAGYAYSHGLRALNATGHVWDVASLTAFIAGPNAFLSEAVGPGTLSKMPFGRPQQAADIATWLARLR